MPPRYDPVTIICKSVTGTRDNHMSFVIGSSVWVHNDMTVATCAAKIITLSRTPDFTPFGEFKILPINDIYIT